MKTLLTKKNVIVAVIIAIISTTGGSTYFSNKRLKNNLTSERLKSESLLSQKLQLDKSLELSKKDVAELHGKTASLEKLIAETNQKINQKNAEINNLKARNASIPTLRKKVEELEALKNQRDEEIANLNKSLAQVQSENSALNSKIASAEKTNSHLSADNNILKALISDNYRIEALRGRNEKLTVNARKTNKLLVSFDLPANLGAKDIYFKVFTPEGMEFSSDKDLAATISFSDNTDHLLASADHSAYGPAGSQRVEMSFNPKQKLTQGVYRFNLYNGDRFLGSTQLRLK